jgi:hypothetical protein
MRTATASSIGSFHLFSRRAGDDFMAIPRICQRSRYPLPAPGPIRIERRFASIQHLNGFQTYIALWSKLDAKGFKRRFPLIGNK